MGMACTLLISIAVVVSCVMGERNETKKSESTNESVLTALMHHRQMSEDKLLERCRGRVKNPRQNSDYTLCQCHAKRMADAGVTELTKDIAIGCCGSIYVNNIKTANPTKCCGSYHSAPEYDKFFVNKDGFEICQRDYEPCAYNDPNEIASITCGGQCLELFDQPTGCDGISCSKTGRYSMSCTSGSNFCGFAYTRES